MFVDVVARQPLGRRGGAAHIAAKRPQIAFARTLPPRRRDRALHASEGCLRGIPPVFFGEGVRAGRRDRFFDTRAPSGAHLGYGVLEPRDVLRSLRAFLRNSLRKRPAVPATVLSVLVFDVSIVRPRRSFAVSGTQYLITFGVMRIVELAAVYPVVRRNVS